MRVLQVTIPPTGKTEPMHHHHWPSSFLSWETGVGRRTYPGSPGNWSVGWMKREPMHAIEVVENTVTPGDIPLLRVEIKVP